MSDREPRVWLLNLDAERELEQQALDAAAGRPVGARGRYAPHAHLRALVRDRAPLVARRLAADGDLLLIDGQLVDRDGRPLEAEAARGHAAVAWSPTPHALRQATALGLALEAGPACEILARVNARPFTVGLLDDPRVEVTKQVALDLDAALTAVARPSRHGWLVRRAYGMAGRGRRRLHAGRPADDERRWLEASLRSGPLVVEPYVQIVRETTRCARLSADGQLSIAPPGLQHVDPGGAWLATESAEARAIRADDDRRLLEALERAGAALHAAGYFGPFGIDAFWHRPIDGGPGEVLQPLSEINARLTMDWSEGLSG